jgi:prepilin peptidase CpaA
VTSIVGSQVVLILTAAVLFYVALTDLKHYKIRNEFILVLIGLFFLHALLSGRWATLYWNIGFAALLFLVMLYFYSMKLMGGGDLKLLTVAFLWVGPFGALTFALFLLLFSCIHLLAVKFNLVDSQLTGRGTQIAFAPSIAAALISVFMLGFIRTI